MKAIHRQRRCKLPTVSLEAMTKLCSIDTKEGQYVAVTDIPGAFLCEDMNECMHMIMEDTIAKHVAKLELQYTENTFGLTRRGNQCCV